jgi:hypothetical protein
VRISVCSWGGPDERCDLGLDELLEDPLQRRPHHLARLERDEGLGQVMIGKGNR